MRDEALLHTVYLTEPLEETCFHIVRRWKQVSCWKDCLLDRPASILLPAAQRPEGETYPAAILLSALPTIDLASLLRRYDAPTFAAIVLTPMDRHQAVPRLHFAWTNNSSRSGPCTSDSYHSIKLGCSCCCLSAVACRYRPTAIFRLLPSASFAAF